MTNNKVDWREEKAALIIAHPGHELRVHHWLERAKPVVIVLTDGSGRTGKSRLESTSRILRQAGARQGAVYGRLTDAEIYQAMLGGEEAVFVDLLQEIADCLVREKVDYVVADALEGYNTSHEICRYLAGAACEIAQRRTGREVKNYDFLLVGSPDECPDELRENAIHLGLSDEATSKKLAIAEEYVELRQETESALEKYGRSAFSSEWLRPVSNNTGLSLQDPAKPFYETYGEKQVADRHYHAVIRYREHVLPVAEALWASAEKEPCGS